MEYTSSPVQPRSLVRRLAPWTAALGLFAGGGFSVYRYAVPSASDQAETKDSDLDAAETDLAKDHYQQLFGAPSNEEPAPPNDRYASMAPPTLPPLQNDDVVTTPRDAAKVTNVSNPFTAPPASGDDRYASPSSATDEAEPAKANPFASTPAAKLPDGLAASVASETPEPTVPSAESESKASDSPIAATDQTADEPAEIARGQEPSANPLRAAASRPSATAGTPEAARAAFAAAADDATASTPQTLDLSAKSPAPSQPATPEPTLAPPASAPSLAGRYVAAPLPQTQPAAEPAVPKIAAASEAASATQQLPRDAGPAQFRSAAIPELGPTEEAAPSAEPDLPQQVRGPSAVASSTQEQLAALAGSAAITPTPGLAAVDGAGVPGDRALEGVQSSAVTIQKLVPQEIQVNKKCTFAVRVQNTSQRTIHNVQILDEVPLGTKLVGAAPKADVAGSQVTWSLGSLPPGEERIVEMELLPSDEGEIGSVATVTYAAQASAKVRSTRPELALRLSAEPRVMVGQQHIVQIEVSNPGSGDATGVMLLESIPEGVSHEAGPALEFPIGTLKAGQSRTIDLILTAEQAGRVNNVMTARGDANLQVEANCEFEVIAPALKISVAGPKQRLLERPATYMVTVANPGTAAAKDVQLITQLPKGLKFVSANNMGEYDASTNCVHWSLAELPANESGSVELTALAVESGEQTLQVATRAQGLEDRAEARVMVEGIVALSFEARAVQGAIAVGEETAYEIKVVNEGSKIANNVQVVAVMPEGIRAASNQGESRHEVQGERIVFAPLPQLAPKAEAKFRVNVQGLRPGDQRTSVQVTADEVREPITKELSTQVYSDQ